MKEKNPWLNISISDYVNHMSSPEVRQYQLINECFKSLLLKYDPKRIFVPGCTIGNGFEYINWEQIEKVTALDINPDFLTVLKDKFPGMKKLEIINEDFQHFEPDVRNYDLIFVALLFEYVDFKPALNKLKKMMNKASIFFSLTQLPGENQSKVSRTEYKSLEKLNPHIILHSPIEIENTIINAGFQIKFSEQKTLPNGKSFLLTESYINT